MGKEKKEIGAKVKRIIALNNFCAKKKKIPLINLPEMTKRNISFHNY